MVDATTAWAERPPSPRSAGTRCTHLLICHSRGCPITLAVAILLALVVVLLLGFILWTRGQATDSQRQRTAELERVREESSAAELERKAVLLNAQEEAQRIRSEVDAELRKRRAEVAQEEQRGRQREEALERRRREIEAGEQKMERREREFEQLSESMERERGAIAAELERVGALTRDEARAEVLGRVEGELEAEVAERIRDADARVREEAGDRAREVIIQAMQRTAADTTGEASVTVLHLPSDDLKGRIIGREGRNIRALEAATGVDVIVDDTPEAVLISGFDPIRREVARMTLEKLFADGRIHPARIEEVAAKSRIDLGKRLRELGEEACQEAGLTGVHPELVKLLGSLHFRNSYGMNVLVHSREVSALCGMLAAEIGADESQAREIGLLHDIGKAVDHQVEGSHAVIGAEVLARLGRPQAVVSAVRAHHYDEEPHTPGAFILLTADAISVSRPGTRREALSANIKRVERLEAVAEEFEGVERSFAVQAGREVRVFVKPEQVDDHGATVLARKIAKRLQGDLTYTGAIKVVVLRETRSVEYAK